MHADDVRGRSGIRFNMKVCIKGVISDPGHEITFEELGDVYVDTGMIHVYNWYTLPAGNGDIELTILGCMIDMSSLDDAEEAIRDLGLKADV